MLVGAGYDGRALRYAKAGVRWFEIDHPTTQADKRQRLTRLEISATEVTFIAADLADDIATALTGAGFEPDAPSLLLWEGVAVYLDPSVPARVLAQLRSIATAGTRPCSRPASPPLIRPVETASAPGWPSWASRLPSATPTCHNCSPPGVGR